MKKISVFIAAVFFIVCCFMWDRLPKPITDDECEREKFTDGLSALEIPEKIFSDIYKPLNFSMQKAMWFTYMDYEKILSGKNEEQFTEAVDERFKTAAMMGINTVYVQVRGFCDAYYKSRLFPNGNHYTDTSFDPLEIMIRRAHSLGLSFHAWINPLRSMTTAELDKCDSLFLFKQWYENAETNGRLIVQSGERWYLNPAYPEVRGYVCDGVAEIIKNYNVDGIHIDDYFYPTTETSFDAEAFKSSGAVILDEWRRENINGLVKKMYATIKAANCSVVFGISPQGNIEINYEKQYADVEKWLSENGFCDYIVPQIYYGYLNESCPFPETVSKWENASSGGNTSLIIGLCTYKVGTEDKWAGNGKNEWIDDSGVTLRQVKDCAVNDNIDGIAIYSYASTFEDGVSADIMVMGQVQGIKECIQDMKRVR